MKSEKTKKALTIFGVLAAILCLGIVYVIAGRLDRRMNDLAISRDTYESTFDNVSYMKGSLTLYDEDYYYSHNFENYLIMGTDLSGNEEGEGEAFENNMADFLMLMSIDKSADTYTLIELNRDTITDVRMLTDKGETIEIQQMQLCIAHAYGGTVEMGCSNQVWAVSNMLGELKINGYYSIGMDDIEELNHAIGGVRVTLDEDIDGDPELKKGNTVTLTDSQAALYLRARMSVGEGTNEERMARQHAYLDGFISQSREKAAADPRYYYDLLDTLERIAVTNLTGTQISRIAKAFTQNEFLGIRRFDGESDTGVLLDDGLEHAEYYIDPDSFLEVMQEVFLLTPAGEDFEELSEGAEDDEYWEDDEDWDDEDLSEDWDDEDWEDDEDLSEDWDDEETEGS